MCHEAGGASVLAYSQLKQRMFSGGKRGEVCIFDIRQNALIQSLSVHTSAITCMEVNDVEGYIVTGSTEGDIKVGGCRDGEGGGCEREGGCEERVREMERVGGRVGVRRE